MNRPPIEHQGVPTERYPTQLQLLPSREGIPASVSSPNLVQDSLPADGDESGPPSPQSTRPKRACSVPRPTDAPPPSDVRVDLEQAKLERFRQWLHCIIIGTESSMTRIP